MSQSTYNVDPGPGQAGQLASSADHQFDAAKVDQSGGIASGLMVVRATNPEEVKLPSAATDITDVENPRGIAYLDPSLLSPTTWADDRQMTFLEKGEIYVVTEEAVTAGGQVFVRHAAGGGGSQLGAFRTDADTASAALLANAVYAKTTSAAGIAVVKFYR